MNNAEFAKNNKAFRQACVVAGVEPTKRQAGRFRRGAGAAFSAQVHTPTLASLKRFAASLGVRGVSKMRAADRREIVAACRQAATRF